VLTKGPEGQLFEHVGEFLRVEPPSRLTYSWRWVRGPLQREETLVQLEFVAERGGTRVHLVHSRFIDTAQRDAHVGWEQAFERLADWLVTR
ncbi:MAG: SRPBCC domain-containing protein, partial [Xanthomonadales bacterium]|nr:SRPBCC domain-containing protein [Xanthomonadales bacterium]